MTPSCTEARRGGARGAASVEALAVIPVFVVLLAAVVFAGRRAVAALELDGRVRACGWLYSANACGAVPSGCEGMLRVDVRPGDAGDRVRQVLEDGVDRLIAGGGAGGVVADVVQSLVARSLAAAFGQFVEVRVTRKLERSAVLGGGVVSLTGSHHLACNVESETPGSVADAAWSIFRP